MPVLNLRNLPAAVHQRLRLRAASHGRSMESEAKEILSRACGGGTASPSALQDWVANLYAGRTQTHVVDDLIAERRSEAQRE